MDELMENDVPDQRIPDLILLKSMYPRELSFPDYDMGFIVDQQEYYSKQFIEQPISALFKIDSLEVHLTLPYGFPDKQIELHCRILDASLNKNLQKQLNENMKTKIKDERNTIDIIRKIIEIWEETDKTVAQKTEEDESLDENVVKISRFWIYSHHIYSSEKRKSIKHLCKTLRLNGFMLIGKPGFICVEGRKTDCDEFWTTIRQWNWQRITLIDTECFQEHEQAEKFIFEAFEEHSTRSPIFHYLVTKNCCKIIKDFLGSYEE